MPIVDDMLDLLIEGKYLSNEEKSSHDQMREILASGAASIDPESFRKLKHAVSSSKLKSFRRLKEYLNKELERLRDQRAKAAISKAQFFSWSKELLENSYREAYRLGVESTGTLELLKKGGLNPDFTSPLTVSDLNWIKGAFKHENRFFSRFLKDIEEGKGKLDYKKRANMYSEALDNMYKAGQVSLTPTGSLIHWHVDRQAEHCPSCLFLEANGPYTKWTLPTTPKGGLCKCLSNCKCRLVMKQASRDKIEATLSKNGSRDSLIRKLNKIKRK